MHCIRCEKSNVRFEIKYNEGAEEKRDYLCTECFERAKSLPYNARVRRIAIGHCPVCDMTMDEYLLTGMVGCSACYSVFGKELHPYIIRMHGYNAHCGKQVSAADKYELAQKIRKAEKTLQIAIARGEKERVEELQAAVKDLTGMLFGGEGV